MSAGAGAGGRWRGRGLQLTKQRAVHRAEPRGQRAREAATPAHVEQADADAGQTLGQRACEQQP